MFAFLSPGAVNLSETHRKVFFCDLIWFSHKSFFVLDCLFIYIMLEKYHEWLISQCKYLVVNIVNNVAALRKFVTEKQLKMSVISINKTVMVEFWCSYVSAESSSLTLSKMTPPLLQPSPSYLTLPQSACLRHIILLWDKNSVASRGSGLSE